MASLIARDSGVAVIACAEERSAQPDFGCALFDGDGVIVRHPHGERFQRQFRMTQGVLVAQFAQPPEVGAHGFGIA